MLMTLGSPQMTDRDIVGSFTESAYPERGDRPGRTAEHGDLASRRKHTRSSAYGGCGAAAGNLWEGRTARCLPVASQTRRRSPRTVPATLSAPECGSFLRITVVWNSYGVAAVRAPVRHPGFPGGRPSGTGPRVRRDPGGLRAVRLRTVADTRLRASRDTHREVRR